jgi:hypothetical protein
MTRMAVRCPFMSVMLNGLMTSLQQYGQLFRMTLPLLPTLNVPNRGLITTAGSSARQILDPSGFGFQQSAGHWD